MNRDGQARLRRAGAGLIKALIRARCRQQPEFLSADQLERWGVADVHTEDRTCVEILHRARQFRGRFERDFLQGLDSIPAPGAAADAEAADAVIDRVASFLYGDLDAAIRRAARNEEVRWEELADWNRLASLRDALDRLHENDADDHRMDPEQAEAEFEVEDGPIPPDSFNYGGQSYPIPAGLVFRLIEALWRAPNRTLPYEDLAELVWEDHAVEVTDGKLGSLRSRANDAFRACGLPLRVQTRDGYARLVGQ